MFTALDTHAIAQFAGHVRDSFPGGSHLHGRVTDGPYHLITISTCESPNWLAAEALGAFPTRMILTCDNYGGVLRLPAYLLSHFAYEIVTYWQDEYELLLGEQHELLDPGPDSDAWSTDAGRAAAAQTYLRFTQSGLCPDNSEVAETLEQAVMAAGGNIGLVLDDLDRLLPSDGVDVPDAQVVRTLGALRDAAH